MEQEPTKSSLPKKQLSSYAKYSAMGIQMAAIIVGGVLGGIQLDKWLALKFPVFTLVFTLLSVFLAMYYFIKDVIKKK
ncbi:MAG TPA: AtpZ/AtpI family protein [Bacteroidia bacterium]